MRVVIALIILVMASILYIESIKNSTFQGVSEICKIEKSEVCDELIKFGVDSKMYLNDENYQKSVDVMAIKALENKTSMAAPLAKFTLEYAVDNKVKLAMKVIEYLEDIIENENENF